MADSVQVRGNVHLAVAVNFFAAEAFAVLVNPDITSAFRRNRNACLIARITNAEERRISVHMPEFCAHGL